MSRHWSRAWTDSHRNEYIDKAIHRACACYLAVMVASAGAIAAAVLQWRTAARVSIGVGMAAFILVFVYQGMYDREVDRYCRTHPGECGGHR